MASSFREFLMYVLQPNDSNISDNDLRKQAANHFDQSGSSIGPGRAWSHIESDEIGLGKIYKLILGWLMKKSLK